MNIGEFLILHDITSDLVIDNYRIKFMGENTMKSILIFENGTLWSSESYRLYNDFETYKYDGLEEKLNEILRVKKLNEFLK